MFFVSDFIVFDCFQFRYAALMTFSACAEGCFNLKQSSSSKTISQNDVIINQIVNGVIQRLRFDDCGRVRYAACNAIGQMCTDFGGFVQEKFHELVVLALCEAMSTDKQPRYIFLFFKSLLIIYSLQAHAAAALVNFCESSTSSLITPYLDRIFPALTLLLNTPILYLQEQAITTLAVLADCAGEMFIPYYQGVMRVLLNLLKEARGSGPEWRLLRGI